MLKIITLNVGILLAFTSCAQQAPIEASKVVGTWRWLSVDGNPVQKPFFIRYYDNGIAASWPAPAGWATPNGASYGTYSVDKNQLVLHREELPAVRADFELKDDKLIVIGRDSTRLIYERVVPDREPGSKPPDKEN